MNIGQAAKTSGVSAKMIRYYESIGLIHPAARSDAGYRHFGDIEIHTLRFIRRSRDLGFTVEQISELLALWQDRSRKSADVKKMAMNHVAALRQKIDKLESMVVTLTKLASCCHGDERPDCPILEDLSAVSRDADDNEEKRDRVVTRLGL
jgi:Cu(I)-responsive transcriptional regulator